MGRKRESVTSVVTIIYAFFKTSENTIDFIIQYFYSPTSFPFAFKYAGLNCIKCLCQDEQQMQLLAPSKFLMC